jgi:hypothetical protein
MACPDPTLPGTVPGAGERIEGLKVREQIFSIIVFISLLA